jgi:hypothetical protein
MHLFLSERSSRQIDYYNIAHLNEFDVKMGDNKSYGYAMSMKITFAVFFKWIFNIFFSHAVICTLWTLVADWLT